jgi:hypothetical protein
MYIRPTRRGRSRSLFIFIFFLQDFDGCKGKYKGGKIIFSGDIFLIRFWPRDNQTRIIQILSIVYRHYLFFSPISHHP